MICRQIRISVTLVVVVLWSAIGHAQASISAAEAKDHVGEKATICGEVISTHYAAKGRGNATFLNIDKSSPNQIFTVVIWGRDLPKFGDPEETYRGKHVCVTGKISLYRRVPEVVANEPSQIKVQ
jgi:DNA/RNA endonuclease YhcR with UshA esterase domain